MMHVVFVVVGAADSLAMVTFAPVEVDVHSCLVGTKPKQLKCSKNCVRHKTSSED